MNLSVKVLDWGDGQKTEAHTELLNSLFRQEIAIWHKLDHPNVAKVIPRISRSFIIVSVFLRY